ncbi:hypothetical protein PV721_33450 [Streptomyces sp. MB09-01]|uniref:hypothetical protein n=1 Tax=Streptomyces sp. MB09-01 TaxID=3028666 RepID=UPI0029BB6E10|nr:hypothetical protein [Streptomyces sp. MB09-01]MDX3539144.1 hypothetical protein [Streptomyces sp. MB09-01]
MKDGGPFGMFGMRFLLVSVVPMYAAGVFLLVLVWAGAPGRLRFADAWETVEGLKAGETVLLAVTLLLVALLTAPFQLRLTRLLEGFWPAWTPGAAHLRRRAALQAKALQKAADLLLNGPPTEDELCHAGELEAEAARLRGGTASDEVGRLAGEVEAEAARLRAGAPSAGEVQRAGELQEVRRRRYPAAGTHLRATRLGNRLAAAEQVAGRAYGWDAVVAWPRLYPVLGAETRKLVDERRDTLDTSVRLAAVGAVTAVMAFGLLAASGWWLLLAGIPLVVAVAAYQAAVESAEAYGEALTVAFDLHRFDLLRALRLPLPGDRAAERAQARELCEFWRQGRPVALVYDPAEPLNINLRSGD